MESFTLQLITPEKTLLEAKVSLVTIPGTEGEFGVMQGHAPFVSTLRPGIISVEEESGGKKKIAVVSGIAEAAPDHCTILAENAIDCTSLTASEAEASIDKAKTELAEAATPETRRDAEKKLALAQATALAF